MWYDRNISNFFFVLVDCSFLCLDSLEFDVKRSIFSTSWLAQNRMRQEKERMKGRERKKNNGKNRKICAFQMLNRLECLLTKWSNGKSLKYTFASTFFWLKLNDTDYGFFFFSSLLFVVWNILWDWKLKKSNSR